MNNYLMLWFDINGYMYGSFCKEKNIKSGFVDIKSKTNHLIARKDIRTCEYVSQYCLSKKIENILKWSNRNKLFKKYPELKAVSM